MNEISINKLRVIADGITDLGYNNTLIDLGNKVYIAINNKYVKGPYDEAVSLFPNIIQCKNNTNEILLVSGIDKVYEIVNDANDLHSLNSINKYCEAISIFIKEYDIRTVIKLSNEHKYEKITIKLTKINNGLYVICLKYEYKTSFIRYGIWDECNRQWIKELADTHMVEALDNEILVKEYKNEHMVHSIIDYQGNEIAQFVDFVYPLGKSAYKVLKDNCTYTPYIIKDKACIKLSNTEYNYIHKIGDYIIAGYHSNNNKEFSRYSDEKLTISDIFSVDEQIKLNDYYITDMKLTSNSLIVHGIKLESDGVELIDETLPL